MTTDNFAGTQIDRLKYEVSAPLGGSSVSQNSALLLSSDGSEARFCNTPGLFGPGAGIALRRKLSGDFDVEASFAGFEAQPANFSQAFVNIYQDAGNQLHIKRLRGGSIEGIQTVAAVGGQVVSGALETLSVPSGKFRITRAGTEIVTSFDGAEKMRLAAFGGDVIVSLVLLAPGGGVAAVAFTGLTVNAGTFAEMTYCPARTVPIKIKPGSSPATINLNSRGVIPVAILSSADFDATKVNPSTVTLASAPVRLRGRGAAAATIEDVNGDGRPDMLVQIDTEALQLSEGATEAVLEGETVEGVKFTGSDTINVVP